MKDQNVNVTSSGSSYSRKNKKLYQCTFQDCKKSYTCKSKLDLHLNTHYKIKPFTCSLCPNSYYKKYQLEAHFLKHTGDKNFQCDKCSFRFYTKAKLKKHTEICGRTFVCNFSNCKKVFIRHKMFLKHISKHNDIISEEKRVKDTTVQKKKCDDLFLKKIKELKRPECSKCGSIFSKNANLQKHIKTVHEKAKEFRCNCGKEYLHKKSLIIHQSKCQGENQDHKK